MTKFISAALLTTALISGLTSLTKAEQTPIQSNDTAPVISQLAFRDRTVTITSHPSGYRYSIADASGSILSTALTEEEIADQYPGLFELLLPAVAGDDNVELMMLAPLMK
ncbi:MAG: hypothetical protein AAGF93_13275 [Cyanobacteria bacterium P01_H01_bin.105]